MGSDLTPLRVVWLGCAVLGAALAMRRGFPAPDALAALVLALWCLAETNARRNWVALVTLPALALGLGCALPLYLFIRSRKVV